MVHTCFETCRPKQYSEYEAKAFTVDERPFCTEVHEDDVDNIICLSPYKNEENCEVFQPTTQYCLDPGFQICYDWYVILYSLIFVNVAGLIFETAFAFSFEISLTPTNIEILEHNHYADENMTAGRDCLESHEEEKIPNCGIVLSKCLGELLGIFLYLCVAGVAIVASIDTLGAGKPYTCLFELVICFAIDQVKSIPVQFVVW